MAIEKLIALDNVDKLLTNKDLPDSTHIDMHIADAYVQSQENAERVEELVDNLNKQANEIKTENPEEPKVKEKNMYTKLTLDESLEDFTLGKKNAEEEDDYLDYDMFNFVYGLVTDDWPRPKNPLGRPMRKFQHTDSDDYKVTNTMTGMSQVSGTLDGDVVIYANDPEAFNDVKAACDHYHITYGEVTPKKSKESHWGYSLTIHVPQTADGYPMMVEDFFDDYGLSMSDVIEDHKVGGGKSANWGKTYQTKTEKDRKELDNVKNDTEVENIFTKHVHLAGRSNDPLEGFIKDMFTELKSKGLKFSRKELQARFMAEFDDDFEDDEE